jgi:hypothetical protein
MGILEEIAFSCEYGKYVNTSGNLYKYFFMLYVTYKSKQFDMFGIRDGTGYTVEYKHL